MRSLSLAAALSFFLIAAGSAQAAPAVTGTFDLPDQPSQTHPALDNNGNIWVTFNGGSPDYAKVAPDGTVTPYDDPSVAGAGGIVFGPDGNLWVTVNGKIVNFSPSDPTNGTATPLIDIINANTIIVGPDGNLWTGSNDKVLRIPPNNPAGTTVIPTNIATFAAKGITTNGGKIWVADGNNAGGGILPVSLDGTIGTELTVGATGVQDVAGGPAGQVGYTAPTNPPERIGLINNGVLAAPFFTAPIDPFGIIYARDENYWVTQFGADNVVQFKEGVYSPVASFPTGSGPRFLTQGAGDTVWVVLEQAKKIVRISGVEVPDSTPPTISKLKLTNSKFKVGKKKTALIAKKKKTKTGTTIKFTLSEAGTVTIAVEKAAAGRKSGKSCVKPTRKLKKAKKCTRYVPLKSVLTRTGALGANRVAFSGRLGSTKLKPGKYRFALTAKDARGNVAPKASRIKFQIVPK